MTYAFGTIPCGDQAMSGASDGPAALLAEIRARREEFAAKREIAPDIIERFKRIGVYRALVATAFGGDERSPAEFCRLVERIAEADGSAGWVASFGASAVYLAALPERTLRELYADGPDIVFAGGLFPLQPAKRTREGLRVKGRWKFASGCSAAEVIGVGVSVEGEAGGGLPRVAVLPASQVGIRENWDVVGLQGTGSHDLVVDDVAVPEEWTFVRGGPPSVDAPVYRYPTLALAAQVLAVVGLGIARSALDEVVEMAGGRLSLTGAPAMADRALCAVGDRQGRSEPPLGARLLLRGDRRRVGHRARGSPALGRGGQHAALGRDARRAHGRRGVAHRVRPGRNHGHLQRPWPVPRHVRQHGGGAARLPRRRHVAERRSRPPPPAHRAGLSVTGPGLGGRTHTSLRKTREMRRRDILRSALGIGLGLAAPPLARRPQAHGAGQGDWPNRQLRWVVGYPAGGTSDVLARLLGRTITDGTGHSVVVEKRPGGGAIVATEAVIRAPADGHTVLQVDNGVMVYNAALYARLPFDPDADLLPVGLIGRFPMFVVVRRDSPIRDFADMLAAGRRGDGLTFATPAVASPHHLAMEVLMARSGLEATHVPFRGTPAAIGEMLSGRVDCMVCDVGSTLPLLRSGDARALLTVDAARSAQAPDVPTARELGYDAVAPGWQGVCVAKGTPPSLVEAMDRLLQAALASGEGKAMLQALGANRSAGGPKAFADYIRSENALWRPLIRRLGLRMDA